MVDHRLEIRDWKIKIKVVISEINHRFEIGDRRFRD